MEDQPIVAGIVGLLGALLTLAALWDVFMTVFYARAGTGPLSRRFARAGWAAFRKLGRVAPPRHRDLVLSLHGPVYLAALIGAWVGMLIVGFALMLWPALGRSVVSSTSATPRDFATALYFAGGTITTVGSGDLRPVTPTFKCLTVLESVLGISLLTLSLTYIIQIYNALQRRNALVLSLHHSSGGTGDAAVLLRGLGPRDDFSHSDSQLAALAAEMTAVFESHHFYPVVIYFRFAEPHYAMARGMLLIMELLTLIDTALDDGRHGWLSRSASVTQLREAGLQVLTEFTEVYLPAGRLKRAPAPQDVRVRWRERHRAAVELLRAAGISTVKDVERAADRYVELRQRWNPFVVAFAHYMEHPMSEIDPAGIDPGQTGRHREMPAPQLRAVG